MHHPRLLEREPAGYSGTRDRADPKLRRRALLAQPLCPSELVAPVLEQLARRRRDEELLALGRGDDAGGDVDVDAEIVAAEPTRLAPVDPAAHPRRVSGDLDRGDPVETVERGLDRGRGVIEDGHQPVSEPFDDGSPVVGDVTVEDAAHLAQELDRGRIADLE